MVGIVVRTARHIARGTEVQHKLSLARTRYLAFGSSYAAKAAQVAPGKDDQRRAFRFGGWELNLRTRRLTSPEGKPVELTKGKYSLLTASLGAPHPVFSRDQSWR